MSTEYYKCGLYDIGKMMCKGPYLTKAEADKDHSLYWTIDPVTLSVWSYYPSFIKNRVLNIKHAYNTSGVFTFKPESK
jgi:hypothetical protein